MLNYSIAELKMVTISEVWEWSKLTGLIIFMLCVISVSVLITSKAICELFLWLFSRPKSNMSTEIVRQYEIIKDLINVITYDKQLAECHENYVDNTKKSYQLKGEVERIRTLRDCCFSTNNAQDKDNKKVLNNLLFFIIDIHIQMMAESEKNDDIYSTTTEDIILLCSDIRKAMNKPSRKIDLPLFNCIFQRFYSKHRNHNIKEAQIELNNYIERIEDGIDKIKNGKDNGQTKH